MKNQVNTINQNGCSVCEKGKENFTVFSPAHRPANLYYQYDFRYMDGELFSTVAPTLEHCRAKRDKWLQKKNYQRLSPLIMKKIQDNKKLHDNEMVSQISIIKPRFGVMDDWYVFSHEEIASTFNQIFGTAIEL